MKVESIIQDKPANGIEILEFAVKRDSESGFQIFLKGQKDIWKTLKNEAINNPVMIGGVKCDYPRNESLKNIQGYFLVENRYECEDSLNLTLLLAKDIEQGVTFNFGYVPISDDRLYDLRDKLKEQVKRIYLQYIKPVDTRVFFNTSTCEEEIHD